MKELNEQIQKGEIRGVYLLYGEENYLVKLFEQKIRRALLTEEDEMMNLSVFSDPKAMPDVLASLETLPFMVEKKLVLLRDMGLCRPGEDQSALTEAIERNLDTTVVVITETAADKRSQVYKYVAKNGKAVEFAMQGEDALIRWIRREAANDNKKLDESTATFFVHYVGHDMNTLATEWKKLLSVAGPDKAIDRAMIQEVCAPNIEESIFKITDNLASKKAASAMRVYSELLSASETPQHVLMMIMRQFRQLLRVKLMLKEGRSQNDIAAELSLFPSVASILIRQSRNFEEAKLEEALETMLDMDAAVKRSELDAGDACTMLIMNLAK